VFGVPVLELGDAGDDDLELEPQLRENVATLG
jgi:hypothetical protein